MLSGGECGTTLRMTVGVKYGALRFLFSRSCLGRLSALWSSFIAVLAVCPAERIFFFFFSIVVLEDGGTLALIIWWHLSQNHWRSSFSYSCQKVGITNCPCIKLVFIYYDTLKKINMNLWKRSLLAFEIIIIKSIIMDIFMPHANNTQLPPIEM